MTNNKAWKQVAYKTGIWLAAEIWLNIIGIDDIADYSEFVFSQDLDSNFKNRRTIKIAEEPAQFCYQIEDFCPIPRTINKSKVTEENENSNLATETKKEVLKNRCQKLKTPCLKIIYLSINIELEK